MLTAVPEHMPPTMKVLIAGAAPVLLSLAEYAEIATVISSAFSIGYTAVRFFKDLIQKKKLNKDNEESN